MQFKQKYFIDSHKGLTPIFILLLINYFNAWNNIEAVLYLALHGTYGALWVTKSFIYPDKQWEQKTPLWYGLVIWTILSIYWISPYIIVSGNHFIEINTSFMNDTIYLGFLFVIYIIGIFLHFTSDMQKYIYLKHNPGNLITEGMFKSSRNPNYLGELLIYLGFTLIAKDFLPIIGLLTIIVFVWIPNMIRKDKSLSRYENFKDYKKKSKAFFPYIF